MTVSHKQLVFHNCLVSGSALFLLPNRENWKWAHIEVSSFMPYKKIQQVIFFKPILYPTSYIVII